MVVLLPLLGGFQLLPPPPVVVVLVLVLVLPGVEFQPPPPKPPLPKLLLRPVTTKRWKGGQKQPSVTKQ